MSCSKIAFRPEGSYCSYSGYLITPVFTGKPLETLLKASESSGLSLDIGPGYVELAYEGRDTSEFVVSFLKDLAVVVGTASGEIRCEITVDERDPLFEFFQIRDGKLTRQRGQIVREQEEDT